MEKERKFHMKKIIKKIMGRLYLILFISGAFFLIGGATTQVKSDEASDKEYREMLESFPFPPGKNAKLAKQVCSPCHSPDVVIYKVYDEPMARKYYERMLFESPDTEQGKKVIEYLITVLGDNNSNFR